MEALEHFTFLPRSKINDWHRHVQVTTPALWAFPAAVGKLNRRAQHHQIVMHSLETFYVEGIKNSRVEGDFPTNHGRHCIFCARAVELLVFLNDVETLGFRS